MGWKISSGCIFGATVILLYAISSAYHTVTYAPAKRVLQTLDHMAISANYPDENLVYFDCARNMNLIQ